MEHYAADERFLIATPDSPMEIVDEKGLADALREHGPEWLTVWVQLPDSNRLEELFPEHTMVGKDDQYKYYRTVYTGAVTDRVADIGWDV